MKIIAITLLTLSMVSCNYMKENIEAQKDWKQIQNSKEVYDFTSFVIKHPKSKHVGTAVKRQIVLRDSLEYFFSCNKLSAGIYHNKCTNKVLFHHDIVKTDNLKNKVYKYLLSKEVNTSNHTYNLAGFNKKIKRTYGHIIFPIDTVNYDISHYKKSIREVVAGLKMYETFLIEDYFEMKKSELSAIQKQSIEDEIYCRLSFCIEFMNPYNNPAPPPPPPKEDIPDDTETAFD